MENFIIDGGIKKIKAVLISVLAVFFALAPLTPLVNIADAQTINTSGGMVSITFDDGNKNIWDNALPVMSGRNVKGVFFGETGPISSGEDWVVTWSQVQALQNTYGWEIGSHSISHPNLIQISDAQLDQELSGSKQDFANHGIYVKAFATPYGDYDNRVLAAIAKYYESNRAAWGGANIRPFNRYQILAREVSNTTTPAEVKGWINSANANNQWLVLLFHEIVIGTAGEYQYNVNNFTQIIDSIKASTIRVVSISEGLSSSIPVPTPTPIPGNYITDWQPSDANVTVNQDRVSIVGGSSLREAASGMIAVNGSGRYTLKMNQTVSNRTAGGWAVWVDEFDANGNYTSGKWLSGNYKNFNGVRSYNYKPTSGRVAKVSILLFVEKNSKLTLNINSAQLVKVQ